MQWQLLQQNVQNWLDANITSSPEWAILGLIAAIFSLCFLAWLCLSILSNLISWARHSLRMRAIRKDDTAGYSILIAPPRGRLGKHFGKRIQAAIAEHLPVFSFGVPFRVNASSQITGGLSPDAIAKARTRLEQTDADLIVWGHRSGRGRADLVLYGLTRAGNLRADEAKLFNIECSGDKADWTRVFESSVVYSIAKALQPSLTSPEAFRTEKLQTIVDALDDILTANVNLTPGREAEFEADFCATSVHIGEAATDLEALTRVISLRRAHLARPEDEFGGLNKTQAKLDLGRALLAHAEQSYDSAVLDEAVAHLSEVADMLKESPLILKAQTTNEAIHRARQLVENRKRFALNFGSQN